MANWVLILNFFSPLILVIVTVIYSWVIYKSFKSSRIEHEVRDRAYLSITQDQGNSLSKKEGDFTFIISNAGKTPAKMLSHEIALLKCEEPGEKFTKIYRKEKLNQKSIISTGGFFSFPIDELNKDKKKGLIISVEYLGVISKKKFKTKMLFKLEGGLAYPIDSFID